MKSVRALMALQALEQVGSILATTPEEEALENEAFDDTVEIVLATRNDAESARATVANISEIVAVRVVIWTEEASPVAAPREQEAGGASAQTVPQVATEPKPALTVPPQTVRVDVARLDRLLNSVGELVIDRTRLVQLGSRFARETAADALSESLNETASHVGRITDELQSEIMKARMLPIDNVFDRFPRMIRDLAQKLDKRSISASRARRRNWIAR